MTKTQLRQIIREEIQRLNEGYTNYWEQEEDFDDREWSKIVKLVKDVIKKATKSGIVIRGGSGQGKPKINGNEISLNGDGKDGLDHETFRITKKQKDSWNFTKTNRKPYDKVVATILLGIKRIAPKKFTPSSDGTLKAMKS